MCLPHSHISKRSSFHKWPNAPSQHQQQKPISPLIFCSCSDMQVLKAKLKQPCQLQVQKLRPERVDSCYAKGYNVA